MDAYKALIRWMAFFYMLDILIITQEWPIIDQLLRYWDENRRDFRLEGQTLIFCPKDIVLILGLSLNGIAIDIKKPFKSVFRTTHFINSEKECFGI